MHYCCLVVCKDEDELAKLLEPYIYNDDNYHWEKSLFSIARGEDITSEEYNNIISEAIDELLATNGYDDYFFNDDGPISVLRYSNINEKIDSWCIGGRASEILYSYKSGFCERCSVNDLNVDSCCLEFVTAYILPDGVWNERHSVRDKYVFANDLANTLDNLDKDLTVYSIDCHY